MYVRKFILNQNEYPELSAFMNSIGLDVEHKKDCGNKLRFLANKATMPDIFNLNLSYFRTQDRSHLQNFNNTTLNGKNVTELVSVVHHGQECAKILLKILQKCPLHHIKLKKVTPRFSFRVDSDGFNRKSLAKISSYLSNNNFKFTWFVDVEPAVGQLGFYKDLYQEGHEIQLHCYKHLFQPNVTKFKEDIIKAKCLLEQEINMPITGFAGPSGRFTTQNYKVLEGLQFKYVSDFSYSYDFCSFKIPETNLVQVPIFPFSIGRAMEGAVTKSEYVKFLKKYLFFKYTHLQDVILYAHPENRMENYLDELNELLVYSSELGFSHSIMGDTIKTDVNNDTELINKKNLILSLENYLIDVERFRLRKSGNIAELMANLVYKIRTRDFIGRETLKNLI